MGQYIEVNDVEYFCGKDQLTWLSQPNMTDATTIDTDVVNGAIAAAENEIDERLYESCYEVPLVPLTSNALVGIKRIAIQLAIWDMASGQQIGNETQLESLKATEKTAQNKLTLYASKASTLRCQKWYDNQTNVPVVVPPGIFGTNRVRKY
ncbi:MAG: DUF1320 domain-containing protein [Pseudomonadales bacterium]|nr:DUF1320 domain-containing protein [Pseudomonadales bacterium]NQZ06052.1 DUF1320 family protein [Algicola sp.]